MVDVWRDDQCDPIRRQMLHRDASDLPGGTHAKRQAKWIGHLHI
jgi:hypothetical protein